MSNDCYYDDAGCLVCPERPAAPGTPTHVEHRAVLAWNAGANSRAMLDGDVHAVFDMPLDVIGVVIGFKGTRAQQTAPSLVEHGWYFQKKNGLNLCQPIERGRVIGAPLSGRTEKSQFEIRRVGGRVTYHCDGAVVATSTVSSHGPKLVNVCLYATADGVPSDTPTQSLKMLVHHAGQIDIQCRYALRRLSMHFHREAHINLDGRYSLRRFSMHIHRAPHVLLAPSSRFELSRRHNVNSSTSFSSPVIVT